MSVPLLTADDPVAVATFHQLKPQNIKIVEKWMEGIINVCTNLLNHHSVVVEIDRHCLSSSIAVKVKKKKKKSLHISSHN